MALTPRLELRHSQSLVMTPQLQQAIKLLQFSNLELNQFVEEELAENPMLERDESLADGEPAPEPSAGEAEDGEDPAGLEDIDLSAAEHVTSEKVDALDMEGFDNVWDDPSSTPSAVDRSEAFSDWGAGGNSQFTSLDFGIEQSVSQDISLRDHILNQIQIDISDPADRLIAIYLTDQLDEVGRIDGDLDRVAERLGCAVTRVEDVLTRIQAFDPSGIFARSLAECWAIQLREKDRFDPAMATLLDNIELLKLHDYDKLSELCHVDKFDIRDMIDEIWSLDHRPAEKFDLVLAQPITPDVNMRPGIEGKWIIELDNANLPKVLVNQHYYAEVSGAMRNREDKQYLAEKFQSANWLVKSLHQRATTILKVSAELVKQQDAFFTHGVEHLKPLVLRDIAEEIEMHESTVSRVTSNKFINTPRGIYELKYFFSSAINATAGGDAHSGEAVRHKIRVLIEAEDIGAILSDDKLVKLLRGDGVDIARRTVAKYRESMHIPSSVQRRREKKAAANF